MKIGALILLIFLITCSSSFGQDKPVLVDEFERGNCEETKARVDAFMISVLNHPSSLGVIEIYLEQGNVLKSIISEELLRGSFLVRKYDLDRIRFVRSKEQSKPLIRMWIVPKDSKWNLDVPSTWSLTPAPDTKPFIVGEEWFYGDDICPPLDGVKILAELLNANPASRSNIVVRPGSRFQSARERRAFLSEIGQKYGIPKSKVRFFFARRTKPKSTSEEPDTEFWFLP